MKYRYPMIDLCKLYCALLVVFIHVFEVAEGHPVGSVILNSFTLQAVPYFFIVSGFLIGERIKDRVYVKEYSAKILVLYFVWCLLNVHGLISTYWIDGFSLRNIALIVRRIFLAGYGVYWYLLILVEAVAIIHVLNNDKVICFLSVIGVLLGIEYDMNIFPMINELFYVIFSWSNNFIMKGIPFVFIGYMISTKSISMNKWISSCGYAVLCVLNVLAYKFMGYGVLFPLQAVTLFLIAISGVNIEMNTKSIRDLANVIYFTHTIFLYNIVDPNVGAYGNLPLRYVLTCIMPICLYILVKLLNNKFLNKLFSI